eukprot:gnl/TRDRNA2_/TRDRNA2_134923_c0_seq2.p1 gnl/TRDRNA2_/TRDRNA2_134923_c0~~gnl/TRDRNA2_/TRDRNA2_134923_c0_seq2.p1  ORF type:complete len:328 (+),score=34.18 gnl/TRDRNA2_/TRDRNA2_134923_c0_seq2:58-1041(+)
MSSPLTPPPSSGSSRFRKRVLEDLTNTAKPHPPNLAQLPTAPIVALQTSTLPEIVPVLQPETPDTAATVVQRFSLKSRRVMTGGGYGSTALGRGPATPMAACMTLRPPPTLFSSSEHLAEPCTVRLCLCSMERSLQPGRNRLCRRNTGDHMEYGLLNAMARRFANEMGMPAEDVSLAERVSAQQLEAYFLIEPSTDTAVGYVALSCSGSSSSCAVFGSWGCSDGSFPTVVELYVEPESRRRGVATAAMRVLLAGRHGVIVAAGSAGITLATDGIEAEGRIAMRHVLARLGFQHSEMLRRSDGLQHGVLFLQQGVAVTSVPGNNENVV